MLSHEGLSINWNSENFLGYHDILVRHAFGSMREILSEISYSGMMARYLTYQDSGSRAASGTSPDENYARELMQLFSVGLIELGEDGSKQLDAHGNPIETYSTENIQEFARCWTGFSLQSMRVNIQNEGHAYGSRIDPMRITPALHASAQYGALSSQQVRQPDRPDAHHWQRRRYEARPLS